MLPARRAQQRPRMLPARRAQQRPHILSAPQPCRPLLAADPKVVAFYRRLREQQLRALGLDPADFKTVY